MGEWYVCNVGIFLSQIILDIWLSQDLGQVNYGVSVILINGRKIFYLLYDNLVLVYEKIEEQDIDVFVFDEEKEKEKVKNEEDVLNSISEVLIYIVV